MEAVTTPLRQRHGADSPRVTPTKHSMIAPVRAPLLAEQDCKRARSDGISESLRGSSVISIAAASTSQIVEILRTASAMQQLVQISGGDQSLKGKILATVFYEPSTRTNCSFQAAMQRLGGSIISINESSSSIAKGETLSDTVRCLECYCDAIVLRHPRKGAAREAAEAMRKPLLNAGDGVGEHPTQALLDLFTIVHELSGSTWSGGAVSALSSEESLRAALKGRVVTMVGDLLNGRTVHSLSLLLSRFDVKINCVSPSTLRLPVDVAQQLAQSGKPISEFQTLDQAVLAQSDILYVTRVQKERFHCEDDYNRVKDAFIITPETLAQMRPTARVMHPLPRVGEISPACDTDPRAAYFRQMENGMYVRMALLRMILA